MEDDTKFDRPSRPPVHDSPVPAPDFGPRYHVLARIGQGGMGEVYRAYDNELKGDVALKVVRGDVESETALGRFRREIALARKVTNPNVLRVYDLAEHRGLRFVSMEYVEGEDLGRLIRRESRVALPRALSIFRQVCEGLSAAHAQGVIHRDLKPQNVLVGDGDTVRVADFGLARSIGDSGMTASGAILGSPAYMSPEQVKGEPAGVRSDIYALGVMLYQLVAGRTPFQADTPHAVMEMRLHRPPPSLRDVAPEAPVYLCGIAERCLQLDPAARYGSVDELLADLDAARTPPTPRRRHRRHMIATLATLVAASVAVVVVLQRREPHAAPAEQAAAVRPVVNVPPVEAPHGIVLTHETFANETSEPLLANTLADVVDDVFADSTRIELQAPSALEQGSGSAGSDSIDLDAAAKTAAARDHVRVIVLHARIAPDRGGYTFAVRAVEPAAAATVLDEHVPLTKLDEAIPAALKLAVSLRERLGDSVSDAERTRTSMSLHLDADNEFELGSSQSRAGDVARALPHLERAVALDPTFVKARRSLIVAYRNAFRYNDTIRAQQAALKYVDRLSEMDRLFFFGDYYYSVTDQFDRSIAAFEQIRTKWPRVTKVLSPLAISYQAHHEYDKALEIAKLSAQLRSHDPIARGNLPIYEILAGNFDAAITELQANLVELPHPMPTTQLLIAQAALLLGHIDDANAALAKLREVLPEQWVFAAADAAIGRGRLIEARAILQTGLRQSEKEHRDEDAADALEILADLELRRGNLPAVRAAALRVKNKPDGPVVLFEAALALADAGDRANAAAAAKQLAGDISASHRAMAKLIDGELLRVAGKPREAVLALQDALHVSDQVYGHVLLARAALDAKLYTDAYAELKAIADHRGQIVLGVEGMTYRYWPPCLYYLARAQEGLHSPDAKATYASFLEVMKDADPGDPLVADAKQRSR